MVDNSYKNIAQRSYSALLWNYLGTATRASSQFLIGIVLARLLGPEAFGTVAIGWLMVALGNLIADFGFSAAIIQNKTLFEKDIRFAFTAQVALGVVLTLIGFFSAEYIAKFFHHANAVPVIRAMSFLFILQAIGQTSGALLRRKLNFKVYQVISITSYLSGYLLIGIPLASFGFGVWSLVAAQLTQSLLFSLISIFCVTHSLVPIIKPESQGMFAFGSKVIGANLTSWGISNIDSLLIGRMLGVIDLGIYNRAMVLISTPLNTITTSLQSVLFAATARSQEDIQKVKRGFLAANSAIGLICLPIATSVASVPETIVMSVYGEKWVGVIPILPPIAIAIAINALLAVIGPVLMAQNRVGLELRAQIYALIFMIPVLYFASYYSLQMIVWGVVLVYMLRWGLLLKAVLYNLNISLSEFIGTLYWPIICSALVSGLAYSVDHILNEYSDLGRLLIVIGLAVLAMLLMMKFFGKKILHGAHGDILLADGRIPKIIHRFLGN